MKARTTFQQLIAAASTALYACPVAEGREGAAAAAIALGLFQDAHDHLAAADAIRQSTGSHRIPRSAVEQHLFGLNGERPPGAVSTLADGGR